MINRLKALLQSSQNFAKEWALHHLMACHTLLNEKAQLLQKLVWWLVDNRYSNFYCKVQQVCFLKGFLLRYTTFFQVKWLKNGTLSMFEKFKIRPIYLIKRTVLNTSNFKELPFLSHLTQKNIIYPKTQLLKFAIKIGIPIVYKPPDQFQYKCFFIQEGMAAYKVPPYPLS